MEDLSGRNAPCGIIGGGPRIRQPESRKRRKAAGRTVRGEFGRVSGRRKAALASGWEEEGLSGEKARREAERLRAPDLSYPMNNGVAADRRLSSELLEAAAVQGRAVVSFYD